MTYKYNYFQISLIFANYVIQVKYKSWKSAFDY